MVTKTAKKSAAFNYSESRARGIFWFLIFSLVFLVSFFIVDHILLQYGDGRELYMVIPGIYVLLPLALLIVPFFGIYSLVMVGACVTSRHFTSAKYYFVSIATALIFVILYYGHTYLFPTFFTS